MAGIERVTNGGFETGDLTGWTITGDTTNVYYDPTEAHSGDYVGLMHDSAGAGSSFAQSVDLTDVNELIFWAKSHVFGGDIQVYIDTTLIYNPGIISTTWQLVNLDVSSYSGTVAIKFVTTSDRATYIDDVSAITTVIPPVANCNGPYTGIVSEDITFDGSGSTDPDGTIVLYEWDFGDGNTDTGMIVTHSYDTEDIYTVTLTVTDNDGATDVATCQCVVTIHIISINPVSGYNHVDTDVTIYGSGFVDGCTITIDGTSLTNVTFISSFEVTATVPSGISKGDKDVKLINPDTSNITLTNGFLVKIRTITTAPTNKGSRLRSRTIYNIIN